MVRLSWWCIAGSHHVSSSGREVESEHERVMSTVIVQLQHERPVVRKRANACLGAFAVVVSDTLLNRLMESLLGQIETQQNSRDRQTLIQVTS
jgi:hypothetical protein